MCSVTQICIVRGKDGCVFFCREPGHLIADCKRWNQGKVSEKPKGVALVHTAPMVSDLFNLHTNLYCPFIMNGSVSLLGEQENLKPITSCEIQDRFSLSFWRVHLSFRNSHTVDRMC